MEVEVSRKAISPDERRGIVLAPPRPLSSSWKVEVMP